MNQPPQYPQYPQHPQRPQQAQPVSYGSQPYGHQQHMAPPYYVPSKQTSGKAIASLCIGLGALMMMPLGLIANIVGLILGISALKDTKEPDGTHKGRGLAIGGIWANIIVWCLSAAMVGGLVALFYFAANEQTSRRERSQAILVEGDLEVIRERLTIYYFENNRSLGPGGPVVRDNGGGGLFADDHPKVTGTLKLSDLVREWDLMNSVSDYRLEAKQHSATVHHDRSGTKLEIRSFSPDRWEIISGPAK